MTSDKEQTPYENPMAGKTIGLAGRFNEIDQYYAMDVINRAGATARDTINTRTNIAVIGVGPGKKLDRAIELGVEIWDEARLLLELERYNEHLASQANAYQFDPLRCAVKGKDDSWHEVEEVLGLPVANRVHQQVLGNQQAYSMQGYPYDPIWEYPGADTLQALVLRYQDEEEMAAFVEHLGAFPNLRALVVERCGGFTLDGNQLFEAFPNLEVLYMTGHSAIEFDISRHNNLQQLVLNECDVSGLDLISLPKLSFLHVDTTQYEYLQVAVNTNAFPQLLHLEISDKTDPLKALLGLPAIPSLRSINLEYLGWDIEQSPGDLEPNFFALADWEGAAQLTHIGIRSFFLNAPPAFKREYFPNLQHIWLRASANEHDIGRVTQIELADWINLSFSQTGMSSATADELYRILADQPPLASLDLQFSNIGAKRVREKLNRLPYPVYF